MNYLNVGKSDLGGIKVVYTSQISYPLFKKKLNAGVLIHKLPSSALHPKKKHFSSGYTYRSSVAALAPVKTGTQFWETSCQQFL